MDFSFIDTLIGAGLAFLGMGLGRRRQPRKEEEPQPICGCEHHYSMHDAEGCHAQIKVTVSKGKPILSSSGSYVVAHEGATYKERPCACKRYTGPEPLPQYFA